ncbi:MAG: homocysteine S-methyltransferase family protein [Oscillospiraceae bacterium]|nr:homocysteine S-methyltransferase family protein [Oscillospiraceae bacterium]
MDFKELLKKDFIILDGGQGTEFQRLSDFSYEIPEMLNFENEQLVGSVIRSYAEAGSDIVNAATFGANSVKLRPFGVSAEQMIAKALSVAKEAVAGYDTLVALDVSTIGQLLEPTGTLSFESAYDLYKEMAVAGEKSGADLVFIETMTDLLEVKAALLAVKENTKLPVLCSMTFEENGRTFTGCSPSAMALALEGLSADAVGVNCSLGPKALLPIVEEILSVTKLPVIVKPNAGLPDPKTGSFALSPAVFAEEMREYARLGVKLLGGCCGTTPEHIRQMKEAVSGIVPSVRKTEKKSAVCTYSTVVEIDRPRIIGERINPTGKKLFKQALLENNIDYILSQAIEQVNAGADILDVNVGLPEIDEKEMMVRVVKALQSVTDVPLQIDSTKPEVIEAALRVYNGKPIVNSVNGEDAVLDAILPLIKKYGAAVVGLTLDSGGIPPKAEQRIEIAKKIIDRAAYYGIDKSDVYIDCLVLTASAEQEAVMETLRAVDIAANQLGVKTVLGCSNISFGLPERELINHTFLAMALARGLTLPIINPNIRSMMGTVRAYKVLSGVDKNSSEFVRAYSQKSAEETSGVSAASEVTIGYAIANGLKGEAARLTERLLLTAEPMDIVSNELIPALDKIGADYESGKIYLPQLIMSAEVSGVCFDIIKAAVAKSGGVQQSGEPIVIATVKGDIHDIGKNIVKVLLENYGYQVIDLGKDVPESEIVAATVKHKAKLVGLSALMTTTLPAMKETIAQLRASGHDCAVMVGGAVLTPDYAASIGADHYARDAKGAVDIARMVLGGVQNNL